jgi:ribonuclease P protein component
MNEPSATPSKPVTADSHPFPKTNRILRSSDFRKVYDQGSKFSCAHFAAFCLAQPAGNPGPRVGFTVSRANGKAVVRNRLRRRMREAVRLHLWQLDSRWEVVFNPRKAALTAPMASLEKDVERLFAQCKNS